MTEALLFLHLLSAAALFTGITAFNAIALGARPDHGSVRAFVVIYSVGLVGLLLFGIALAIDIDGYEVWSGWVLIALGLWLAAGATGEKLHRAYLEADDGAAIPSSALRAHWINVAIVLLLLADMVGKPWA